MARLIDVDKLIENLNKGAEYCFDPIVNSIILDQPHVDAVEVVRCRDCIFSGDCNRERSFKLMKQENPFCCVGMRK